MNSIFYDKIKENKPEITEHTIINYVSILKSFYLKNSKNKKTVNKNWFLNTENILNLLEEKQNGTQKNYLCAIQAFLGAEKLTIYTEKIALLEKLYQQKANNNQKSTKEKNNWKSHDELIKIYDTYYNNNKNLFTNDKFNEFESQILQNIIILALTCGKYFQVRRAKDWYNFKINGDILPNINNYIDEDENGIILIFNDYKTTKCYGKQTIKIDKNNELYKILSDFVSIKQETNQMYLFVDKNNNQLSHITFNQRLNKLYGGHIGTSLIRHIQTTDDINKNIENKTLNLNDLNKDAISQGHNLITHLQYYKNEN